MYSYTDYPFLQEYEKSQAKVEKQKNRERTGQNVVKLDLVSQGRSGVRCWGDGFLVVGGGGVIVKLI